MGILIGKTSAKLLFWLYEFLDAIFEMFRVLCGIDTVEYTENGETVSRSIVEIFIESSVVTKAFLMIFLVSIIVCAISVIVSVVKNIVNMKGGERKSHAKTVGQGLGAIIITLVMGFMMIFGIWGSNIVLQKVYFATSDGSTLTIANRLFDMSVSEVYVYDYDNPTFEEVQQTDEYGNLLWKTDLDGNKMIDDNGDFIPIKTTRTVYPILKKEDGTFDTKSGWCKNKETGIFYNASDIHFGLTTVDDVFGVRHTNLIDLEKKDSGYVDSPMVELDSFNFVTAYFVLIMVLVAIIWSMLGLVKRIFDLVQLFIMLPLISATIPLDDGARLKAWRDTVVSKVILAYGAVISVNVFLLIIPVIQNIDFVSIGWSAYSSNLFKMFMLIGGALCINGGQLLIARVFGTSAEESREMAQSARALVGGAAAAGGILHSAKNAVFGGTNKYGRHTQGAMRVLGKTAGVATNAAGNILGGQAYRSTMNKAAEKVGSVVNSLRGLGSIRRSSTPSMGGVQAGNVATANNAPVQQSSVDNTERQSAYREPKTRVGAFFQNAGKKVGSAIDKGRTVFKNGVIGAVGYGINKGRNAYRSDNKPNGNGTVSPNGENTTGTDTRVKDMAGDMLKSNKPDGDKPRWAKPR